jgi:hypothetical protein
MPVWPNFVAAVSNAFVCVWLPQVFRVNVYDGALLLLAATSSTIYHWIEQRPHYGLGINHGLTGLCAVTPETEVCLLVVDEVFALVLVLRCLRFLPHVWTHRHGAMSYERYILLKNANNNNIK